MYSLVELDIVLQMVHHHSIVIHVDEYRANVMLLPYLPYDFQHQLQLYRFHILVYLGRVSFDLPLKHHVQHHRLIHIGNDSIRYLLHLVYKLDMHCNNNNNNNTHFQKEKEKKKKCFQFECDILLFIMRLELKMKIIRYYYFRSNRIFCVLQSINFIVVQNLCFTRSNQCLI